MIKKAISTGILATALMLGTHSSNIAEATDVYAGEETRGGLTQVYYIDDSSISYKGDMPLFTVLTKTVQPANNNHWISKKLRFKRDDLYGTWSAQEVGSQYTFEVSKVPAYQMILNACLRYISP